MRRMSIMLLVQGIDFNRPKATNDLSELLFDRNGIDVFRGIRLIEEHDILHAQDAGRGKRFPRLTSAIRCSVHANGFDARPPLVTMTDVMIACSANFATVPPMPISMSSG